MNKTKLELIVFASYKDYKQAKIDLFFETVAKELASIKAVKQAIRAVYAGISVFAEFDSMGGDCLNCCKFALSHDGKLIAEGDGIDIVCGAAEYWGKANAK